MSPVTEFSWKETQNGSPCSGKSLQEAHRAPEGHWRHAEVETVISGSLGWRKELTVVVSKESPMPYPLSQCAAFPCTSIKMGVWSPPLTLTVGHKQMWPSRSLKGLLHQVCLLLLVRTSDHQQVRPGLCAGRASLVAQRVKSLPAMRETQVWSLGWEDPLEKEMCWKHEAPGTAPLPIRVRSSGSTVSYGCCYKSLQTSWLKATKMYSLIVLGVRSPKSFTLGWSQGVHGTAHSLELLGGGFLTLSSIWSCIPCILQQGSLLVSLWSNFTWPPWFCLEPSSDLSYKTLLL